MNSQKPIPIFESRAYAGVRQDKQPQVRLTAASGQPATADSSAVGRKGGSATAEHEYKVDTQPAVDRRVQHGSEKRQTDQVTGRVPHHVKSEVLRIAKLNGWTESYTVNTLVQQALARNLAESFGVMLKQTIQEAITTQMHKERKENNRAATLALEAFFSAEEGRVISIYILRFILGEDIDILSEIIQQAQEQAQEALKRYTGEGKDHQQQWQ